MLIQSLLVLLIMGLLISGVSFGSVWANVAVYGGMIGGIIFAFFYSRKLSGGIAEFITGGSGGKINENLAAAERYESQKDFKAAVDAYRKAIAKDKKNPGIRLKLIDLYLKLHNYDMCLNQMQETLQACPRMPMNQRCSLMNRMADIYLQHKKEPAAASAILSQIIAEFPDSKYAAYARERIAAIE
jgi:tetratricopeptide (TPR) repeat protein